MNVLLAAATASNTGIDPWLQAFAAAIIPALVTGFFSLRTQKDTEKIAEIGNKNMELMKKRENTKLIYEVMMSVYLLFESTYKKDKTGLRLIRDELEKEKREQELQAVTKSVKDSMPAIFVHAHKEVRSKFKNFNEKFEPFYREKYLNFSVPDKDVLKEIENIRQVSNDFDSVLRWHQGNPDEL